MKKSNNGFIKLRRDLLSQPGVTDLLAKEGAAGLGLYISINLYLAHCEGGWGVFTGHQLSAIAVQMKKRRSDVARVIKNYGLFVVEGARFTSLWMQSFYRVRHAPQLSKSQSDDASKDASEVSEKCPQECSTDAARARHGRSTGVAPTLHSRAYLLSHAEEIEKEIEKENKEKSAFERVAGGVRHASHGQPLPADAPPQRHLNELYSYSRREWVAAEEFNAAVELPLCRAMFNGKELKG